MEDTEPPSAMSLKPPVTTSRSDLLEDGSDLSFRKTIYVMVQSVYYLSLCRDMFGKTLQLTASQFVVLMGVAYLEGTNGITIGALADHISLAPTHTTTEVGRLVRRKLLSKKKNESDARSVLVSLSPQGMQAVRKVTPLLCQVNDDLFRNISASELRSMRRTCSKLIDNAENIFRALGRTNARAPRRLGGLTMGVAER